MSLAEVEKAVGELELLSDVSEADISIYEKSEDVTFKMLSGKVQYEFKNETLDSVIFKFETKDDFSEHEKVYEDVMTEFVKAYAEPSEKREKEKKTVPIIETEIVESSAMWKDEVSTLQVVLLSSKDKSTLLIGATEFKS